ncbi:unnamed protein product [Cyclocybe aegerita]|uniref:Cohesin subunit rad21 n=1 Tax=Cyclocybe aegerita TaxID=1973307 RepID=A0A8S0WCT6_CYCAE|nr:unnamed protein product [Cyclocybe aegerita]
MERKLSKSQTLQTDIGQSVDAIMGQEIELMALRLSGQLLLGVVRIYSRKAKYLLDDCNEALLKIKMAFRPGIVDLTEEQLTVNKTAITLQTNSFGLDLLLPDVDWDMDFEDRPLQRQGHHQAHVDDITLRTADDFQFGENDPFDIGPSDGIGSQDFNDLDLGINWDDEGARASEPNAKSDMMSVDGSVGVGRDAQIRDSIGPDFLGGDPFGGDFDAFSHRSKSRDPSEQPFGDAMDIDPLPEVDLGDLGIGFDDLPPVDPHERTPSQTRSVSRVASPLTELPATPPPIEDAELNAAQPETEKAKRKIKDKKQIIDSVTELQNGIAAANRGRGVGNANPLNTDTTTITTKQRFLPRSSIVMRLLEIREDPVAYFLPSKTSGNMFSFGPPGLTPELAELFTRAGGNTATHKRKAPSPELSPSKRARKDEVEIARRAESLAPSDGGFNLDPNASGLDNGFEFADQSGAMMDDYQLEVPKVGVDMEDGRAKSVLTDRSRSRVSSVGPGALDDLEEHGMLDGSCPVAVFDMTQPSQATQCQAVDSEQEPADVVENETHGYSKNTVKALGLVRKELQSSEEDDQPKSMSFKKMTNKASRRAAASFFFELLVLGTRDCVQVSQPKPFADIAVHAKARLWEHQHYGNAENDRLSEPPMA